MTLKHRLPFYNPGSRYNECMGLLFMIEIWVWAYTYSITQAQNLEKKACSWFYRGG